MKKWIVVILVLVVVLTASAYIFTPASASFSHSTRIHQAPQGVIRSLYDTGAWNKWWPGEKIATNHFRFGKHDYRIIDKGISSLVVMVSDGKDSMRTTIDLIISNLDSIGIVWSGSEPATFNPITRFHRMVDNTSPAKETRILLDSLQKFYSSVENVYGLTVTMTNVVDTALVSTAETRISMPSTADIYRLLDRLDVYIKKNGAEKTGNPMLNISADRDSILVRVAIPVNRRLPDSGDINYRWMLPGGLVCIAEYKGGPAGALQAITTVEHFLKDRELKQPVIPYQSLVTDRRTEPDTSKWITRIYCPYY